MEDIGDRMSTFTDTVKQDTPRLAVMYRLADGNDQFQWGIVGAIPLMSLIGAIVQMQGIVARGEWICGCDQPALVLAWDEQTKDFDVFLDADIPALPMIGMLETIKFTLIGTQTARQVASQKVQILGPDGAPVRH